MTTLFKGEPLSMDNAARNARLHKRLLELGLFVQPIANVMGDIDCFIVSTDNQLMLMCHMSKDSGRSWRGCSSSLAAGDYPMYFFLQGLLDVCDQFPSHGQS